MSWLENQTILFVLIVSCVLVTSDIYKSVMWTTNNPLFSESEKLSRCFGEDLEMRVHLQSSLPIVCPFDFIIMKTLASKPATGVLYENFWIVYDFKSFDSCRINTTYYKDGDPKERNRKLLECDSPEALKSYTYSIDFKARTPANSGISFAGGEYYYFLATSDGTDGSLNNTEGGHCNDPKVRMKFKVYICKSQGVDEKCQNVPIGEFLCPSDLPEAATTSPPTTVPSQPLTQITTDFSGATVSGNTGTPLSSTITRNNSNVSPVVTPCYSTAPITTHDNTTTTSPPTKVTSQPSTQITTDFSGATVSGNTATPLSSTINRNNSNVSPVVTPFHSTAPITTPDNTKPPTLTPKPESKKIPNDHEFSRWKPLAIVSSCLLVTILIANISVICFITRCKEKHCLCFTNLNKVTSPEKGPQSPEYDDHDEQPSMSYAADDSEYGKTHHQMSSFKPNLYPSLAVDEPDRQTREQNDTQEKEPGKPQPAWPVNCAETT